jgi:hypothetical protein
LIEFAMDLLSEKARHDLDTSGLSGLHCKSHATLHDTTFGPVRLVLRHL